MTPEYRVERLKGLLEELKRNGYKNVTEIANQFSMSASYISQLIGGHRELVSRQHVPLREKWVCLIFTLSKTQQHQRLH
jgi:hypothetical protein